MSVVNKIQKPTEVFISDYLEYLVGASSLIVALAWNSAFQKYFEHNKFLKNKGPWIYAIAVTFLVTIVMLVIKSLKSKLPPSNNPKIMADNIE